MQNINIKQNIYELNYKLYLYLKELNSTTGLTKTLLKETINILNKNKENYEFKDTLEILENIYEKIKRQERKENILTLLKTIETTIEFDLFSLAIELIYIKPFLLEHSKELTKHKDVTQQSKELLSIQYDTYSKYKPFYTRVGGTLLTLYLFANIDKINEIFDLEVSQTIDWNNLKTRYKKLKGHGLEINQIFMLMFSESINQSILSDAGSSYEERVKRSLINIGILEKDIVKKHDLADSSTEFDFFFTLNNKSYGISAKRTLRERYKQFIKTAQMTPVDVLIEITLGIDLTPEKAISIRQHGVYIFVADEVYNSKDYLQKLSGIYPASKITKSILESLK